MTTTAATTGALELSARDAATWTRLFPATFSLLTAEQGDTLRAAGKLGERLLNIEERTAWDLFAAERRATEAAADITHQAQEVTRRLAEGTWVDDSWVVQATEQLTEALAEREAKMAAILANRQLINLLLAEQKSGDPAGR